VLFVVFYGGEDDVAVLLGFGFNLEDGDNMFLRNVVIYRRPYTAPKPRRTASSSEGLLVCRFWWVGS
jgi:hypothetical protein